jgi:hypothetical protein
MPAIDCDLLTSPSVIASREPITKCWENSSFSGLSDVLEVGNAQNPPGATPKRLPKMKIFSTLGLQSFARGLMLFRDRRFDGDDGLTWSQNRKQLKCQKLQKQAQARFVKRCATRLSRRTRVQYKLEATSQRKSLFPQEEASVLLTFQSHTATVKLSSLRVTARYMVSRSNGVRPASVISRTRSARLIPCGVVAPASW